MRNNSLRRGGFEGLRSSWKAWRVPRNHVSLRLLTNFLKSFSRAWWGAACTWFEVKTESRKNFHPRSSLLGRPKRGDQQQSISLRMSPVSFSFLFAPLSAFKAEPPSRHRITNSFQRNYLTQQHLFVTQYAVMRFQLFIDFQLLVFVSRSVCLCCSKDDVELSCNWNLLAVCFPLTL